MRQFLYLALLVSMFSCRKKIKFNETIIISFNNQTENDLLFMPKDSFLNRKGDIELITSYYNNTNKMKMKILDNAFVNSYETKEFTEVKNEKSQTFYIIKDKYFNLKYEKIVNLKIYDSINIKSDLDNINTISIIYLGNKKNIDYLN